MITQIDIKNAGGAILSLPLNLHARPYVVESVDGLDPVKATLISSDFAQLDGALYQASRLGTREIKFRIQLVPNYSTGDVRDLRLRLYQYFMPTFPVVMTFTDSSGTVYEISGRVSTFETTLFSKETSVDIAIECYDPDFKEISHMVYLGQSNSTGAFSELKYEGTADTGIILTVKPKRDISDFSIVFYSALGNISPLNYAGSIAAGDKLQINTNPGEKEALFTRASDNLTYSVLYGVDPSTVWTKLYPGDNRIMCYHSGDPIQYTIEYVVRHGGL